MDQEGSKSSRRFWHGRGNGAKLNYWAEELMSDENAIRDLIATWIAATKAGDTETVLRLIHEDALLMVPGLPPFGKAAFASASEKMKGVSFEGESEVLEVEVRGDLAWCRTRLAISMTPANGQPTRHSGYTLTIFRKVPAGQWQLFRDANLVVGET
jgi:uncharacterized protein (TIGR02246 family)